MTKKRIIILGAGLAGLSVAWHLKKKGYDSDIYERESEPGGLARTKKVNGFIFDYDGHLLHFRNNYTKNFVKGLLKGNLTEHKRSAWVYSHKKFLPYPFQAHLYGLPPRVVRECVAGFLDAFNRRDKSGRANGASLRGWLGDRFGSGIARNFLIPYNDKFWTISCARLTYDWAQGFIPQPSPAQVIRGSMGESSDGLGYNARFFYPAKGGISELVFALSRKLNNISLNSKVTGIDLKRKEVIINSRQKERFDILISTLPLPEMPNFISDIPCRVLKEFSKLKWNSIFNLNLGLAGVVFPEKHWVYFPHRDVSFFRIGFPNNFSSSVSPAGKSSLYAEVSYSDKKPIDRIKIIRKIKSDLRVLGIDHSKICTQDINDIKYGYPIYDFNYRKARDAALGFLNSYNIIGSGRYGNWKYMSMEDAILDGKRVAEAITGK